MFCKQTLFAALLAVVLISPSNAFFYNGHVNQNIQEAFNAAQEAFRSTVTCMKEGKSSCPDAIEAAKKAKRYAEAAHSDDISSLAKTRVRNAIDILEKAIEELNGNWLNEAERRVGYAMGELDEARKAL